MIAGAAIYVGIVNSIQNAGSVAPCVQKVHIRAGGHQVHSCTHIPVATNQCADGAVIVVEGIYLGGDSAIFREFFSHAQGGSAQKKQDQNCRQRPPED